MVSRAIAEPGERSIPPVMITKVDPMDISATILTCSSMFLILPGEKNRSVLSPTMMVTRTTAISGPEIDELFSLLNLKAYPYLTWLTRNYV